MAIVSYVPRKMPALIRGLVTADQALARPQKHAFTFASAIFALTLVAIITVANISSAQAQGGPGVFAPGAFSQGPLPSMLTARMSNQALSYSGCVDFRGQAVGILSDRSIPDVARAFVEPESGLSLVAVNPDVMGWLKPETRLFFFVHECGHHVMGHTVGRSSPQVMEQEADCWAVKQLHDTGLLGANEIRTIQADLRRFGRGDSTHLPGDFRAANLAACIGGGGFIDATGDISANIRPVNPVR